MTTSSLNVLLIEDNPGDARLVKEELLSAYSQPVIRLAWADTLEKGLEHLAAHEVQAVLVDLSLPDSNGLETLQRVLFRVPQIPVIVMTGLADEEMGTRAVQAGAQDYLIKGQVDGRLLARVIHYAIQRKQAEMQLSEALQFTERIVTCSPIGIFTYRLTGECLSVNAAAARMVGASMEQLRGQNFHHIGSWKRSGLYRMAMEAIARKVLVADDVHVLTTFGRDAWYRAQFITIMSDGEELLLMMFEDITDRKKAEAALKASEQRYRELAENFPNGVVSVYNKDLILVFDAGLELKNSGYTAEDFLGKHFTKLASPETWEIARPHLLGAFDGRVSGYEAPGLNGQHYSINVAPLHDPNGEIHEILVVSQNITNLKNAQHALREKERLLSEAQRIGHIGSWSYDIPGNAIHFSDEMYRLLDTAPDEFQHTGAGLVSLVYPADRTTVENWMKDVVRAVQSKELNFRIFYKNGELRYLQCTGAVNLDALEKPVRFVGTVQDVTDRRVAEMQIDQHIRRLTALSKIDRAIISSLDQRYTLDVILSQVVSLLHVDAASVLLVDTSKIMLDFAAGQGFRTRLIESAHISIRDSHAGSAAVERRMVRIDDLSVHARDPLFETFVIAEGFTSYVAVPLIARGAVKGVLEVYQRSFAHPYPEWLDFLETLAGQAAIAVDNAALFKHLQQTNQDLIQAYEATIEGWSRAMDLRDRETEGHTRRVTVLTLELARSMEVEDWRLVHIRRGALLHDIGKLGVPDHILFKTGELTPEEWEIMKKHTDYAYDMLSTIHYLKAALNIPYFHHEKWDGSGYPLGLKGEQIPLEARIFAVADVWDALCSDRPYRNAWGPEKARDYIAAQAGEHFDPKVVECFLQLIERDRPQPSLEEN